MTLKSTKLFPRPGVKGWTFPLGSRCPQRQRARARFVTFSGPPGVVKMTIFLVALLVSSSELELLAIPQTSQEAGATEENKPLFSVEAYSLARPLPQGSLGPCAENRIWSQESQLFGALEPQLYTRPPWRGKEPISTWRRHHLPVNSQRAGGQVPAEVRRSSTTMMGLHVVLLVLGTGRPSNSGICPSTMMPSPLDKRRLT